MKTNIFIFSALCAIVFLFNQNAHAQKRIGGGLAWGSEVEELGIAVNGEVFILDKLAIAPQFIFFFTEENLTWWEIDGDVHFFPIPGNSEFYALGGINITRVEVDLGNFGEVGDTEAGLNLGAGYNFKITGPVVPFAEVKFIVSDADQLVLSGGVRVGL